MTTPRPDGTVQLMTAERLAASGARFAADVEYAAKAEDHVWIAMTVHRVTDGLAKAVIESTLDGPPLLDAESVVSISIGCYICEQPLGPRMVGRRCPGDPS